MVAAGLYSARMVQATSASLRVRSGVANSPIRQIERKDALSASCKFVFNPPPSERREMEREMITVIVMWIIVLVGAGVAIGVVVAELVN